MRSVGLTLTCLSLAGAAGLHAAEAEGPAQAGSGTGNEQSTLLEEIVVTSSRAALPGFSASTPTTVVGGETLNREVAANVAQILNEVPGFKATQSPASNGVKTGTPGSSTADLRALGGQRTLVLVDGLRVPPTAPATNTSVVATVDLNTIPAFMIDRVEVVTGGASAQWGSDAVGGVVNIRLKSKFEGLQLKAQGGTSQRGDGDNEYVGLLGGTNFFDDRGHFVVGAEYQHDEGLRDIYTRPWGRGEQQIIQNPSPATNGLPALLLANNVHTSLGAGGTITGPANFTYRGYTFNPDGTVRPFNFGSIVSGVQMIGGEGLSTTTGFDMIPSIRRVASYARTSYDLTDSLTASLVLSYAHNEADFRGSLPRITGRTIFRDNVFLPSVVADAMVAQGIQSFTFSENAFDLGNSHLMISNDIPRAVLSLNGAIGDTWKWDVGYEYGTDRYAQNIENATAGPNLAFALDAVAGPNGEPVCRATLPGPAFNPAAAGCVPINLFGDGAPSAAAIAYVQQKARSDSRYVQRDATANIKGTPFSTWAGPVAVAFGAEYRKETQDVTASALSASNAFLFAGNATPYSGSFDVKEGYVDTLVPLLMDQRFAKSLTFSGAFRYEDYSSIGSQNAWKAGLDFEPVSGLRFRATHSVDIRAPAIYELYGGGTVLTNTATVRGVTVNIPQNVTQGNPNLSGEDAKTSTYGIVLQPRSGPFAGLSASVDYYDIKIDRAITTLSAATIAGLCNLGNQMFCDFFTFDSTGRATSLNATTLNLASAQTQGIDFNIAYQRSLPPLFGHAASMQTSLLGTRTLHSYIDTGGGAAIDRAGENGPQNVGAIPDLTMNLTQTLTVGNASFSAQALYVSRGTIDNTYNTIPTLTINDNSIGSVVLLHLYGSYDVNEHLQFSAAIRNALDRAPPVSPYPNLPQPQFNGQYYDVNGRTFRVAVMYRF
ncbi:MAG TPA: TonB-dependent receptor [Steroidobacteraceae bacterium]|nr:TonB-dependent receptor [Steroidobacteraceae bacterium]